MTRVLCCDVNEMQHADIGKYLRLLPRFLQGEVTRFRYITDQKRSLAGRLMLYRCLAEEGKTHLMNHWERDACNKPFIKGWHQFNMAHSGDLVLFSCNSHSTGVDIERKEPLNYPELLHHFHPCEEACIRNAANMHHAFYDLWVRKESFLKAVGTGLLNGLKDFVCLHEYVEYAGKRWIFHKLPVDADYTGYCCSPDNGISFRKFPVREYFA